MWKRPLNALPYMNALPYQMNFTTIWQLHPGWAAANSGGRGLVAATNVLFSAPLLSLVKKRVFVVSTFCGAVW